MTAPPTSRAHLVAAGILASRVAGLVREKALAWFFGVGPYADVLRYALRAPNVLQNLLGEQALSASFIPVYSRLLAEGRREDAGRFAGAVLGLLTAAAGGAALLGVLAAPVIVRVLTPGLLGDAAAVAAGEATVDRFVLTVDAVRIIFPMTAVLVLSAWALGILNSHRRFFLSYVAPVAWNAAIIAAAVWAAWRLGVLAEPGAAERPALERILFAACWGALGGGVLQLLVQVPAVLRLTRGLRPSLSTRVVGVRQALAAFGPAVAGRGVVQLSGYLDQFLASFLHTGAMSALGLAFVLYNLPLSVFGSSVAAAELPELASEAAAAPGPETRRRLAERLRRALGQASFFIAPAVVGYLAFGLLAAGLVYHGGRYTRLDNWLVYATLCGYSTGLLASMVSRLLQNTFFAFGDTRTPARIAVYRIVGSAGVGAGLMLWLDRFRVATTFGIDVPGAPAADLYLGALGLSLAAGVASWAEMLLLLRALRGRLPELRLPVAHVGSRLALAGGAALVAGGVWRALGERGIVVEALVVLPTFGALYLGAALALRLPELGLWLGRLRR